jgi:integrase
MMRKAKKLRYITQNPCEDVWLQEAHERREAKPFSVEEEERLLSACEPLLKIFIIVLIETGLRPKKEVLPLEWADVELDGPNPSIHVRKSKPRAGVRHVLLTDFCTNALRRWKKFLGPDFSPYVFPAPRDPKRHWTVYQDAGKKRPKQLALLPGALMICVRHRRRERLSSTRTTSRSRRCLDTRHQSY